MKKILICVLAAALLLAAAYAPAEDGYAAIAQFGEQLLNGARASDEENPVISPLSAYTAMAMVYAGADGQTAAEFEDVLGVSSDEANELCAAIREKLTKKLGGTSLNAADSIWADDRVDVKQSYIEPLIKYYDVELLRKDLQAEGVVDDVNGWIEEKTNGLIPSALDSIDENALLLLVDTLYMDAKWEWPFQYDYTHILPFHAGDGDVETDFMHESYYDREYIDDGQFEGIVLPYDDGRLAFVAVKPKDGGAFDAELTGGSIASWLDSTKTARKVILSLPKFDVEYKMELGGVLQDMGLVQAFDQNEADFSAMGSSESGNLFLNRVLQNVRMRVDEEGTEAAAATVAEIAAGAAPLEEPPVEIYFDSPFMYAVIDTDTNVPLFMGILDTPVQ